MKGNSVLQQKLLLVLITAIVIVCATFIFISCGKGPQSKIADPDKGSYALDFTKCPSGAVCSALLDASKKSIANKDLTVEAWVKKDSSTNPNDFTGGILGRFDNSGIVLYVKNGEPKAAIRRIGASGTATATSDYIVSSGIQIVDNLWHHIAAVLTSENHSVAHADCGDTDSDNKTDTVNCPDAGVVCNNGIHLDIYVDGEYKECNTTYGQNNDTSVTQPAYAGEPSGEYETVGAFCSRALLLPGKDERLEGLDNVPFPGVIDEARFWSAARTQSQISQCKSQELSLDGRTCGRMTPDLLSYLRLNEGTGSTINDWTGLGTGVLEPVVGARFDWTTGWTTGNPDLKTTD
jgi:hypothetical protein